MERFNIVERTVNITESTTLMPEKKYGGWLAVNQGTAAAKVLGYELQPGEGIDMRDNVPAGSTYGSPIVIEIQPGAIIRITRLQALEIIDDKKKEEEK